MGQALLHCPVQDGGPGRKKMFSQGPGWGGWVRMGRTAGQGRGRWPSSLFGYIPFLQDDLSLPGGQLGLVIAQGP